MMWTMSASPAFRALSLEQQGDEESKCLLVARHTRNHVEKGRAARTWWTSRPIVRHSIPTQQSFSPVAPVLDRESVFCGTGVCEKRAFNLKPSHDDQRSILRSAAFTFARVHQTFMQSGLRGERGRHRTVDGRVWRRRRNFSTS